MNQPLLTSHRRTLLCTILALALCTPLMAQHHNTHDERALQEDPRLAPGQIAPVLEGLGDHHHKVTTSSERAQLFFDQGLKLTYGFNHQEALRAFKEAARLDPECAMAYWGWALVLGPNLNLPMATDVVPQAWEAIQTAVKLEDKVSEKERGMIEALAARFTEVQVQFRTPPIQLFNRPDGLADADYRQMRRDGALCEMRPNVLTNLPYRCWRSTPHTVNAA